MSRTVTPQENDSKAGNDNDLRDHTQSADPPRAAECAAVPPDDGELATVVAAWSTLPEAVRARILGLVEGATASGSPGDK